jgi:hypothetical protein
VPFFMKIEQGNNFGIFKEPGRIDFRDVRVFLVSGSRFREDALRRAMGNVTNTHIPLEILAGPQQEVGKTSADRAMHKVLTGIGVLRSRGYFEMGNPVTIFLAADSRNFRGKIPREKPENFSEWERYGPDWERISFERQRVSTEAGYAMAMFVGNKIILCQQRDLLRQIPPDLNWVRRFFAYSGNYQLGKNSAHGLPTAALIRDGRLRMLGWQGGAVLGQQAIDRTYGANQTIFAGMIEYGLRYAEQLKS